MIDSDYVFVISLILVFILIVACSAVTYFVGKEHGITQERIGWIEACKNGTILQFLNDRKIK